MNTMTKTYSFVSGFDFGEPPTPSIPALDRSLLDNFELIQDLARYGEGTLTREQVKRRWKKLITDEMWNTLGSNDELVDRIEAQKLQRVRDGSCKREKAQLLIIAGPTILSDIASSPTASEKHKIDAVKALDSLTGNPAETAQQDRIVIRIDMGADVRANGGIPNPKDVLVVETSPRPNTIDVTPEELPPPRRGPGRKTDTTPQELLPFVTAKRTDGGSGEPI
jgi:hypothetical protein